MSKNKNAVVVGGTGMLESASRYIATQYNHLTLVSRNPERLAQDINATPLSLNWKTLAPSMRILQSLQMQPAIDLLVSWVHGGGLWMVSEMEACLRPQGRSIRIHGSSVGDPAKGIKSDPQARHDIIRQNIVLGWVGTKPDYRWLTHAEISSGVIQVIEDPYIKYKVIGSLDDLL